MNERELWNEVYDLIGESQKEISIFDGNENVGYAGFDEMMLIYPFLWAKECNLETATKKVVSSDELIRMNSEYAQKFDNC